MSLPYSQIATAEGFDMSGVASSRDSQAQVSQSPASPSPPSYSPSFQSPALQSPALSPAFRPLPSPEPAAEDISVAENTVLQGSGPSLRNSIPPKVFRSCKRSHNLYRSSLSPWVWETTSLAIALGLLIAMIVIPSRASNQPEQNWKLPITLSALINTLSTIYRTLLVYVAVEIVNQEKWIWLWSTSSLLRPLQHIQCFEAGSRGLVGSLKLIPLVAKSSPTSLLALVVIVLSLIVGPFAQQSISRDYRMIGTGSASLSATYSLPGSAQHFFFRTPDVGDINTWSLSTNVRRALFSALLDPGSTDSSRLFFCPTGTCEFPSWGPQSDSQLGDYVTHASIGMCNRCHDMSSILETTHTDMGSIHSLPNGMEMNTRGGSPWLTVQSDYDLSWAESVIPHYIAAQLAWSFTNTTILTMGPAPGQDQTDAEYEPTAPVAVSCSLYPCLHTYQASVRYGQLLEFELESTPLYPDLGNYNGTDINSQIELLQLISPQSEVSLAAIQSPCRVNDTIFTTENISIATGAAPVRILDPKKSPDYPTVMAPKECIFRMNSLAFFVLQAVYSKQFLNGNCTWDKRQGLELNCPGNWWLAQFWEAMTARASMATAEISIKNYFNMIAYATTNQFRLGVGGQEDGTYEVYGISLEQVGHIIFRWKWFLLPTLLLSVDIFLLGWMLYRSIRHCDEEMPWKGSLLPLLYYRSLFEGADGESLETQAGFDIGKEDGGQLLTADELEDVSKRVFVRLRRGKSYQSG